MFKSLEKLSQPKVEERINEEWKKEDILSLTIENRKNSDNFVFYDGPATANGMPGAHHMLAKTLKDVFGKYKTMQGYKVLRKVGWDTHGLPVEVQVEKELGFNGKGDIEKYGIKEFNEKCRENVWKNENAFKKFTEELGQFVDLENPYVTYNNDYIETEWWILKEMFAKGLIYDGLKIIPYCPRCGTGLASHEVAQGYKDITVNTVTVPLKLKDMDNTYLLVWTTTPWTLVANVAACVNPNVEYVKCSSKGYNFILASDLASKVLGEEYEVLETYLGKDLEGMEYEQLLPFLTPNKKAFYVTLADYVTTSDGTGIVHIAPAFGADDYEVGLKYNLPVLNPVDETGSYTDGPWKGRFVLDPELEIEIIKYLQSEDKLFKKQKLVHNYPHCWRCKTPLLYYSKNSLYIKVTDYKDKIIEENNKVNWHPSFVGEKRFGNWLDNMNDWAISRNRYWGTPIPLWRCSCGHDEMIGSRKELVEKSIEKIDENIELHRPYVDDVHLTCPKCGKPMKRVEDVIDCWFDSGSMPFAQYHYPFENKELFESQFPADFIAEGMDQTRGWFYSLLVISTIITGRSPYKNVLVNDLVLDKFGQKMHKSRGNAVDPFPVLETYGADPTRWFMLSTSPVWTPMRFDVDGIKEAQSRFFNTLKNTYNFFEMYANIDSLDPRDYKVSYDELEEIDKWLLSKYNKLVSYVTSSYDEYDLTKVVRSITDFVSEDLSNWYIRRNRKRFWSSNIDTDKKAVYQTTYEVLLGLSKMIAPIASFTAEELYQALTNKKSVHLEDFPVVDEDRINEEIEMKMDLVRDLISLGRNAREDAKIKVRQPLSEVILDGKNKEIIGSLTQLINEELNVHEVNFEYDLTKYMNFEVKPNFKVCGPIFGKNISTLSSLLKTLTDEDITKLDNGLTLTLPMLGETYEINKDMVDIKVTSKEGFNASHEGNNFIILNTTIDEDLLLEGYAREVISKMQNLRKEKDFALSDRVTLYYNGDEEFEKMLEKFSDVISSEVLALNIVKTTENLKEYDINGKKVMLNVEKSTNI